MAAYGRRRASSAHPLRLVRRPAARPRTLARQRGPAACACRCRCCRAACIGARTVAAARRRLGWIYAWNECTLEPFVVFAILIIAGALVAARLCVAGVVRFAERHGAANAAFAGVAWPGRRLQLGRRHSASVAGVAELARTHAPPRPTTIAMARARCAAAASTTPRGSSSRATTLVPRPATGPTGRRRRPRRPSALRSRGRRHRGRLPAALRPQNFVVVRSSHVRESAMRGRFLAQDRQTTRS